MNERQELWCHECGRYVQFTLDLELEGNHVLECPNCGHEHCRVVRGGRITDIRWDTRNRNVYLVTGATTSAASTYQGVTSGASAGATARLYIRQSWLNTGSGAVTTYYSS